MLQAQSMAAVSLSQALSLSPATIPLRVFPSETEHSEKDKDTDVDSALTVSFVQALHEDSEESWQGLVEAVSAYHSLFTEGGGPLRRTQARMVHYLHRVFKHVERNSRLQHLSITQAVQRAFPELSSMALKKKARSSASPCQMKADRRSSQEEARQSATAAYFSQEMFEFKQESVPKTFQGQVVKTQDLLGASLATEEELRHFDKVFKKDTITTTDTLQLKVSPVPEGLPPLSPVYPSSMELVPTTKQQDMAHLLGPTDLLKSAVDVIRAFANGSLDGRVDFVYLNYSTGVESPMFDPYSLMVVSKAVVNPEHYVISRFGITHIYCDGTEENFTFAEWCCHTIVHRILKEIPTFKRFFLQKMLLKWKRNVRSVVFGRRCRQLSKLTMRYFNDFSTACIKVKHLANEVLTLQLFEPRAEGSYTLEAFEGHCTHSTAAVRKPLLRLFKLCKQIVSELEAKKMSELRAVEAEVVDQPFVSDLPISQQREKALQMTTRLEVARDHVSRLPSLALLVDRMLSSSLVALVQTSTAACVMRLLEAADGDSLQSTAVDEDDTQPVPKSILQAVFSIQDTTGQPRLAMEPSWDTIRSSLVESLSQMSGLLVEVVQPTWRPTLGDAREKGETTVHSQPVALTPHTTSYREQLVSVMASRGVSSTAPPPTAPPPSHQQQQHQLDPVRKKRVPEEASSEVTEGRPLRSPLEKENFKMLLLNCDPLVHSVQALEGAVMATEEELSCFLCQQVWLEEAHKYVVSEVQSQTTPPSARELEVLLSQLEQWLHSAATLPNHFLPTSHLVSVDCSKVKQSIHAALERALSSLIARMHCGAQTQCRELSSKVDHYCKDLTAKRYDLEGFAEYTELVRQCQRYSSSTQPLVEGMEEVITVLTTHNISTGSLYTTLEETLGRWSSYKELLVSGIAFVEKQTPLRAKGLEENIESHEEEVKSYLEQLNAGMFADPDSSAPIVLAELNNVQNDIRSLSSYMQGLSKWKEIISGSPHDLSLLHHLLALLSARQELWGALHTCGALIKEWSDTQFKKLNIAATVQKVEHWFESASLLSPTLSKEDPVLLAWISTLKEFLGNLRLLQRLTSPAIKPHHWHSIFAAMGLPYDRSHRFTLSQLLDCNITEYIDNIVETCLKAEAEHKVEKTLTAMRDRWESRRLTVKHFPSKPFSFAVTAVDKPRTGLKEKTATFALDTDQPPELLKETFCVVVDTENLVLWLEDDIMSLQLLLSSSRGESKVSGHVAHLLDLLQRVQEILSLMICRQTQWQHLLDLFQGFDSKQLASIDLSALKSATTKIQEVVGGVYSDTHVLSLVQKQHGQRGVRELQGNPLRKALDTLQQDLDDQMKVIEGNLMRARCLHSRLFFVSDRDTLCCMIPHASPLPILPLLRRCYPGVVDLGLVKMSSQDSLGQEDGYHVTSVKGHLGEELVLLSSLPLGSHTPVEWLPVLDQAVQLTLSCKLAEALLTVPEELHFSAEPQHPPDTSGTVVEWLQRHPSQCTTLALEVTWARAITSCVDLSSAEDVRPTLDRHLAAVAHCLQCLSSLMYQLPNKMADKTQRRRMFFLLGSLVLLLRNKHDTVSRLLSLPQPLSASFEWQSLPQYHTNHTSTISEATSSSSISKLAHTAKKGLTKTTAALTLTECHLTHLGRSVPYGFEFQGLGRRVFLLPEVEGGVLDLLDCMQGEGTVFVAPTDNETSIDITRDVAQLLGRPYYSFLLPHCLTRTQACHLVLGIVGVGAVASLGGSGGLGASTAALLAGCVEEMKTKLQEKAALRLVQGRSAESIVTTGSRQLRGAVSTTPGGGSDHSIPLYPTGSAHHQKVDWYSSPFPDCRGLEQVMVQLWGAELLASPTSLCCLSLGQGPLRGAGQGRLPQGVKEGARCVQWVSPDAVQLVQLLLLASGFQSGPALATALIDVWREIQLMVPAPLQRTIRNRHTYKDIIGTAEGYLLSLADNTSEPYYLHSKAKEERAVLYGILALVRRRLSSVLHLGREVLPVCAHHWKEAVDYFRHAGSTEEALVVPEGEEYQVKELSTAVGRELRERHLQELPQLVEKCVALHHALQMGPAVLLWGGACSGKSTMYRILAAAYSGLRAEGGEDAYRQYPRVKTTVIHTKAHTLQELFGCQEDGRPSLLQMVAHQAGALQHTVESVTHPEASTFPRTNFEEVEDQCSAFQHWVILQGPLSHEAATLLAELVENDNIVYSIKAEPVSFPRSVKFIIELEDLPRPPCPSLLASSLVHSSSSTLPWEALVDTWLEEAKTAHNLNTSCQNILCAHMMEGFPLLLSKSCESPFYPCNSNQLVVLFLRLLSAILTRSSSKMRALDGANDYGSLSHSSSLVSLSTSITDAPSSEEETNPSPSSASATRRRRRSSAFSVGGVSNASYGSSKSGHTSNVDLSLHMSMVFCYTAIWATYPVLATSDYRSSVEHDRFVRDVLSQLGLDGEIPSEGLVTDYYVDFKTCTFKTWKERCDGMTVNRNGYITVPEMLKASHFSEVLLSAGHNVILLGEQGMGKTASVKNQIESKLPLTRFCTSPQTSPEQLRNSIMEKYGKSQRSMDMHKGVGLPGKVQKLLLFVDDIHLACLWETGSGSAEEMLHQAAAEGSVTDPDRSFQQGIQGVRFIASTVPSAVSAFSSRFLCQFVPVLLPNLSSESVSTIFRARTSHWLKSALSGQLQEDVVEQLANALVIASVTVHQNVASYTPAAIGPQLPGVSLKEVMAIHSGMKYLSSHQGESKGFQPTPRKTAVAGREKTLRTSRHRRQSSLAASNLPKPGRMKDELTKLARGHRKLKASLETEEEAAKVVLLRSMVRLWCHETARVYGDRFSASKDCFWFANLINHVVKVAFCGPAGLKVVDLGTRAAQGTAIVTARRREKRLGRNLPVLPSTTPDDADDSSTALFEDIRRLGYNADMLSQAHLAGKLQQVIPLDQINLRGEDLSRLMFAPSTADGLEVPSTVTNLDPSSTSLPPISSTAVIGQRQGHEEDREGEKGTATATVYKEMDDRDALSVVEGCVQRYSKEVSSSHEEVVPYRALVEQVLRMARALHLASSHAILLGPRGAGKKTVCQVAACLMDYQVITLAQPNIPGQSQFLDCVRKACWAATAGGRGTALVVSGQLGLHQWNSLYLLMKEGDVESVFTGSEIIQMARQVQQSTSSFPRHLKYSDALNTVKTTLEKNLHILVCWTVQASEQGETDSKEVEDRVLTLLLRAAGCVGHLAPMDVEACSDIALRWMEMWTDSNWKDSISFTGGISALSELAAHVHTTAARVASRKKGTRLTFTPRLFLTCLRMGYTLSLDLQQKEKESMEGAEDVLQALHEADVEVSDIAAHVAAAEGDAKAAQGLVEELMTAIKSHKDEYLEASQRSKLAEAGIAKEGNRVERLTEKLDEAMQQVSSQYNAALHSLSSVQKNDILELMSYHSPPEALKSTLNALCIVFDRPESWEDCQQLLLVKNFFEHLQYFDRDNIPKGKLKYLKKMIASKRLDSAFVGRGSQAALSISSWLKALVAYHSAREVMLPHEEELKRARQGLAEAKQTYSTKHYEMEETKAALERKIQEHRKALQRLRALERHLDQLRQIHSETTRLMSALLPLRESMEKKRDTAAALLHSSPSDGLLVAAAAVYLMTFDPTDQGELVQTWTRYCHGELEPGELAPSDLSGHYTYQGPEKIPLREDFSIVGAFVEEDYFKKGFSSLAKRMPVVSERLIIIKYLSSSPGLGVAPLVFDPHHYLFTLAKAQGKGGRVVDASSCVPQRSSIQPGQRQTRSSGRISQLSTCSEVLSLPGSSQQDSALPPLIIADQLSLKQIEEVLSEEEVVYFIFSSAQAITKEVLDFFTTHIRLNSTVNMAVVILQAMDTCISCTDASVTSLFQLCMQQSSSSLSCCDPLFTIVDLQLGREDLEEFFRQKVMHALTPTLPIRHKAMLADVATHISSIARAELQLKVAVVSSQSILQSRESIHHLATSSTQVSILAEQRLDDAKSQLTQYQKDIEIFHNAAQHCRLLSTCVASLSSYQPSFSLPLPLFDDLLGKVFKLNQVWQPKEFTSQAGLAATAVEQINTAVLPFVASCLSGRCFLHYLLIVCLEIWKQDVSKEEQMLISTVGSALVNALNSCKCEEDEEVQEEGDSSNTEFYSFDTALRNAKFLEAFPGFTDLTHSMECDWELWQEYFQNENCISGYIPHQFNSLSPSCRLLLWAVMCPSKLTEKIAECARVFAWARVNRH